MRPEKLVQCMQ